jgi:predicted membrane channel-forming protein YqfA (hemolysin III family)
MADEDRGEKLDRELIELLNGLRVVLPGVQVLFAFLLTVPFTQRFGSLESDQRGAFFAAFMCTTAASAFLIAPSAYHRLRWRQRDKEQLLRTSNAFAIVGIIFLGLAITATVFVVTDVVYGLLVTSLVSAVVAGLLAVLWLGIPLWRRLRDLAPTDDELLVARDGVPPVHAQTDRRELTRRP